MQVHDAATAGPPAQYVFFSHNPHTFAPPLQAVPGAQVHGEHAAAPPALNLPATHAPQLTAPCAPAAVPFGQAVQFDAPPLGA